MNYSNRVDQKQTRRITKSLAQLATEAKHDLQIRTDKRSGAGNIKGDINSLFFKWELKDKEKPSKSMTVQKEWYDKCKQECMLNVTRDQIPVVVFGFGDEDDIFSMRWSEFENFFREFLKWKVRQDV